jgi:hypothetical protein
MMFVARYKNGDCLIVEASDEASARQLLESNDTWRQLLDDSRFVDNDKIVSLRPLSQPFVSRWCLHFPNSDDLEELLDGTLTERVAEEILQHEYPLVQAAYSTCEQDVANMTTEQFDRWDENRQHRLRQAVELELGWFK